jgi:RNA polymerase sigma factor (sigma-70 family)
LTRLSLGPLLRLRSDEQLVALFRSGSDDAFTTLVDRYQQRLFAYVRQMLGGSRQDAEDVLQDVYVRAYGALRADTREVNVRAWLYRVAHNRCIDQLRRPTPPASEIFEMSRKPLHDPIEEAQRREDLRRLVHDVGQLPEQQRSALLMREIDGMSYADLASALDTSVPAVKSLLVRARVGLAEAAEARDTDCAEIRVDLAESYDRGVKASGRARRHLKECAGCRDYRVALRGVRRGFAALNPVVGFAPLALVTKLLGAGSAGGAGAAGAGASAGGGMALGAAGACKVAAVVCTAVVATGGAAVEVKKLANERSGGQTMTAGAKAPAHGGAGATVATVTAAGNAPAVADHGAALTRGITAPTPPAAVARHERALRAKRAKRRAAAEEAARTPAATVPAASVPADDAVGTATAPLNATGGASAPVDEDTSVSTPSAGSGTRTTTHSGSGTGTSGSGTSGNGTSTGTVAQPPADSGAATGGAGAPAGTAGDAPGSGSAPPPEH